jgi:hypothetical protein
MAAKNLDRCCKARAKSGKPCRAAATAGGLCFFHANPNKASELGRIGGRSKRHAAAEIADPLPVLDSAIAVRDTLARLIADEGITAYQHEGSKYFNRLISRQKTRPLDE